MAKKLSNVEITELRVNVEQVKRRSAEIKLKEAEFEATKIQMEKKRLEIDLLKLQDANSKRDFKANVMDKIVKRLKLKGKWGYNPETGEIIE